jgi:hypothetical protein
MKLIVSCLFLFSLVPGTLLAQKASLSDAEIKAAIDAGKAQKSSYSKDDNIGLLAAVRFAHFQSHLYTPTAWVQHRALEAALKYEDYTPTEDDLRPILRIIASAAAYRQPSSSEDCSVSGVILQDSSKKQVVHPQKQSPITVTYQNGFGATLACISQYAEFGLEDIEKIRMLDAKGEFFVRILGAVGGIEEAPKIKQGDFKKLP